MKPARTSRLAYPCGALLVAIVMMLQAAATGPSCAQTPAGGAPAAASPPAPLPTDPKLTPQQARDAQIAADSQKLFQLAQELKVEVDKSSKDTMSLSVIKKAEEIEKLARALKVEMRAN